MKTPFEWASEIYTNALEEVSMDMLIELVEAVLTEQALHCEQRELLLREEFKAVLDEASATYHHTIKQNVFEVRNASDLIK